VSDVPVSAQLEFSLFSRFCYPLHTLQLIGRGERRGIGKTFIVLGEQGAVMGEMTVRETLVIG
jgi:hypothetical protein